MTRQIIIRPEAVREVQAAFDWYEEKSEGLGFEFLRAADACLGRVRRNPRTYPVVHQHVRRAVLRKFPYALFYLVTDDSIIVIACFHSKRNPAEWLRRVEP